LNAHVKVGTDFEGRICCRQEEHSWTWHWSFSNTLML